MNKEYILSKKITSPTDFARRMRNAKNRQNYEGDRELVHLEMDMLMCKLLEKLGYSEGVEIFRSTPKWYA